MADKKNEVEVFTHERLDLEFSVPKYPTVREQLRYYSETSQALGPEMFERYWNGARSLIVDWKCPEFPNLKENLDEVSEPVLAEIAIWVGMRVLDYMNSLENLPKNSSEGQSEQPED